MPANSIALTIDDELVQVVVLPAHGDLAKFRKRHLEVLAGLFMLLQLCQKAGLVKRGCVASTLVQKAAIDNLRPSTLSILHVHEIDYTLFYCLGPDQ
jgi:hypothetical protein